MPFLILLLTLVAQYGYYFMDGVPVRVYYALNGFQMLAFALLAYYLLFHRVTNFASIVILAIAILIAVAESTLVAICGSWYAFIYVGPPIVGDRCEIMTGLPFSKPFAYTLATLTAIILPRVWKNGKSKLG